VAVTQERLEAASWGSFEEKQIASRLHGWEIDVLDDRLVLRVFWLPFNITTSRRR
jgi:hypothetical protein